MPTGGLIGNFEPQSTRTISIWAGQRDVTSLVLPETLEIEDAATSQGQLVAILNERLADLPELTDHSFVRVFDEVRATEMYRGFTGGRNPTIVPRWTNTALRAGDHGELLDRYIPGPHTRPTGEPDRARIAFFWGLYASPFLSPDLSSVQQVNASLPLQRFQGVTLRRAIDMIAAQASSSARWYLDQTGHLHYFATEANAAPKNITSDTPGAGEIAPSDLSIDYDSVGYANAVYVNGLTAVGSGWVYDHDEIARVGTIVSADPLDAPDSSTAAMRNALGQMYLGRLVADTARGEFTAWSHDADGWRAGQTLEVRSADIGIDEEVRISRVLTTQTKPGSFRYGVEFGGAKRGTASSGAGTSGGSSTLVGGQLAGTVVDSDGNPLLSTALDSAGALGPAVRRFVTAGVFNGDFALAPASPDADITADNQLPYWTFTQESGTAVTARSVEDASAGSGRVVHLAMAAGAAGDASYIEQIVPANGSRNQAWIYSVRLGILGISADSDASVTIKSRFLTASGAVTGAGATTTGTTPAAGVVTELQHMTESVPADAVFLRLRFALNRASAADADTQTVALTDVVAQPFGSEMALQDVTTPANNGWRMRYAGGSVFFGRASLAPAATRITLTWSDLFKYGVDGTQTVVAGTTIQVDQMVIPIDAASPVTLTSTPTVEDPPMNQSGYVIYLMNVGSNAITLQDQGTLAGSNLRLSTATFAMGPRDSLTLIWHVSIGDWIEIARSNVI